MTMPDNPVAAPLRQQPFDPESADSPEVSEFRVQMREAKDQLVGEAKKSYRQARDSAASSLTQTRQQAAERIGGIASALRNTSEHIRSENQPQVAALAESVAEQAERLSSYVRDRNLRDFQADLENFARRRPAVAIGAALAVGVLAARFLKSSPRAADVGPYRPAGGLHGGT